MRLTILRSRLEALKIRLRTFWGLCWFGVGVAIGGNDTPLWWQGHPMSNMSQTIVVGFFIIGGAWVLSDVLTRKVSDGHQREIVSSSSKTRVENRVKTDEICKKCGKATVSVELWESTDGAFEDEKFICESCGYVWWVDGATREAIKKDFGQVSRG